MRSAFAATPAARVLSSVAMAILVAVLLHPTPATAEETETKFDFTRRPFATTYWNPQEGRIQEYWNVEDIPQFVVISIDNAISALDAHFFYNVTKVRQAHVNGCTPNILTDPDAQDDITISQLNDVDDKTAPLEKSIIPATWFTAVYGKGTSTRPILSCEIAQALYRGGHEIGTHTLRDTPDPDVSEILNAINYLVEECGIPAEAVRGFRSPTQRTSDLPRLTESLMNRIAALSQIEYDSTLEVDENNDGTDHYWPFTMDGGIPPTYNKFVGDNSRPYPGLWEVPMYPLVNQNSIIRSLYDPNPAFGRPTQVFSYNLQKRLEGNRAPLGIYLTSAWLASNAQNFIEWIEATVELHPNLVYFVTYSQLLDYMKHPVRLRNYRPPFICRTDGDDEVTEEEPYPVTPGCFPPLPTTCGDGRWDHEACKCRCNGELCRDIFGEIELGTCNVRCDSLPGGGEKGPDGEEYVDPEAEVVVDPIHGGWGEWTSWSLCYKDKQTRIRQCNNPVPQFGGDYCDGFPEDERECQFDEDESSGEFLSAAGGMVVSLVVASLMFFMG